MLEVLISQGRKYCVGMTVVHQHLGQLDRGLRDTLMANTATKIVGGLSDDDLRVFARVMNSSPEDMLPRMRKYATHTDFVKFYPRENPPRNQFSIPIGILDKYEHMPAVEYDRLIEGNRQRYCAPADEARRLPQSSSFTPDLPKVM
jgi:hypothetical protein